MEEGREARKLRKLVVDKLQARRLFYEPHITEDFLDYVGKVAKDGEWLGATPIHPSSGSACGVLLLSHDDPPQYVAPLTRLRAQTKWSLGCCRKWWACASPCSRSRAPTPCAIPSRTVSSTEGRPCCCCLTVATTTMRYAPRHHHRLVRAAHAPTADHTGDAKSSLGDAKCTLGDAKSSLGDAKSSLGDVESSLG